MQRAVRQEAGDLLVEARGRPIPANQREGNRGYLALAYEECESVTPQERESTMDGFRDPAQWIWSEQKREYSPDRDMIVDTLVAALKSCARVSESGRTQEEYLERWRRERSPIRTSPQDLLGPSG